MDLYAEYEAKGWPSIDPRSPRYCYQPCWNGVHVCGQHPDGDNCLTVLNLPTRRADDAVALFERAKAECAEPYDGESDFIVDLVINGDIDRDFRMNRQMLDRLQALSAPSDKEGGE